MAQASHAAIVCLFFTIVIGYSSAVTAQPHKDASSEVLALFNAAKALMDEGKYSDACPMLEKVRALKGDIGVSFNLADCYEHVGRTASAWAGFQDAAAAAVVAGQTDRAQAARERAAALVPKLSFLRIVVSTDAALNPGLDVQREGTSVGRLLWGKSVPVDPGKYVVSATAAGRETWNTVASVEKPGEVVSVDVPNLNPAQDTGSASRDLRPGTAGTADANRGALQTAIVLGSAVISLISLEVGVGFTVAANGQSYNAGAIRKALGGPSACYGKPAPTVAGSCDGLQDVVKAWDTFTNAAIASYVASGLTAAGAVAVYVWWPKSHTKRGTVALPLVYARGAGLGVAGTF